MIDPFVILAPVLLLAVVALLRFVGCNWVYGIEPTYLAPTVSVTLSPANVFLNALQPQQFTAQVLETDENGVVTPASDQTVTWSVNGGDPAAGTVDSSGLYTAPAFVPSPKDVTVTATSVADSSKSASATVTLFPRVYVRVNAGGPSYIDLQNQVWSADYGFTDIGPNAGAGGPTPPPMILNTRTQPLYQSVHFGDHFLYSFPVANATYAVTLKFAELFVSNVGDRRFNVSINGNPVLSNFDIIAAAGAANTAFDQSFPVPVTGTQITIDFTIVFTSEPGGQSHGAIINAIEIVG